MTIGWYFQLIVAIILIVTGKGHSLRCYACMGTQPGCSADRLDWHLVKNMECPDVQDVCVKITEKILGTYLTTRGCMSIMTSLRRDIPGDHYEGCRRGAEDVRYNKDVQAYHPHQNAVSTGDVTFCFCAWDNYCNNGNLSLSKALLLFFNLFVLKLLFLVM
ncbi:hypothetical protein BV898_13590 [Hypsibius exemplaris]|uniref:Protein sleepless n=1 Tax=Hypsibius exemplaris TaxID=2072580 RepID=A0A1W0WA90_HYPEX|nr:hypothetical protein BV898_13590 [Hypsibius exemplaris]